MKETIITKVGSKYFEVDGLPRERFFIDTLFVDGRGHTSRFKVYLSLEDRENEIEYVEIYSEIKDKFNGYHNRGGLTLKQLRDIQTIINGKYLCWKIMNLI